MRLVSCVVWLSYVYNLNLVLLHRWGRKVPKMVKLHPTSGPIGSKCRIHLKRYSSYALDELWTEFLQLYIIILIIEDFWSNLLSGSDSFVNFYKFVTAGRIWTNLMCMVPDMKNELVFFYPDQLLIDRNTFFYRKAYELAVATLLLFCLLVHLQLMWKLFVSGMSWHQLIM